MLDKLVNEVQALYELALYDPVFGVKCIVGDEEKMKLEHKGNKKNDPKMKQKDKRSKKVEEKRDTFQEEDIYILESMKNDVEDNYVVSELLFWYYFNPFLWLGYEK